MRLHDSIGVAVLYYPVFLDLRGRRVLVVGAGRVGLRKIRGLLEAGAEVTVVDPHGSPELERLPIHLRRRRFRRADVRRHVLVFAATDQRDVNRAVAEEARRLGIWVNVADNPAECDFLVPARVRRGNLQIAVSTGGQSPRLAAELRKKLEMLLAGEADVVPRRRRR
ncbi:MAG: bifunctional precorrin-2 dehydrogenase/sirohydrochlorin ferrochelatase [Bryobacterales bacterium]|nr:bifunctional precorrin-2 dehydrogenase/sirohydrochlorin ferrochelatase [Bryobacteraceae bacterium]MDW8353384.1 bifunctional precorrin-2 dehydrogenase/sirohydrochlorin ferrochelatase [Bryobacterales bacterium]